MAALARQLFAGAPGAEEAFFQQLAAAGTPLVEPGNDPHHPLVTFVWRGSASNRDVQLFAGLPRDQATLARIEGSNVFAVTIPLPDDTRLTYSFLVDGEPQPDLLSHRPYGAGEALLELPRAPTQPWLVPHRGTPAGTLWHHAIAATPPRPARDIFIYTPPGYPAESTDYPLLVEFDAEEMTTQVPLPLILDELIAAKRIPPVVALFVGNVDRGRDLMPNPEFADLVALELVPWVRAHYHATSDPARTVVGGTSRGGLAAAFAALRHPEVYGNVLAQSGAFWWGPGFHPSPGNPFGTPDGPEPESLAREIARSPRVAVRFWLETGELEGGQRAANRHLRDVLTAREYELRYREFAGNHSYAAWRGSIADGLIALFSSAPKLATSGQSASNSLQATVEITAASRAARTWLMRNAMLDGGEAALTEARALPIGAVLDQHEVDAAGGALLTLGYARQALPLLRWNCERFPRSASAWESLAWAWLAIGDRSHAIECFTKQRELDPGNPSTTALISELSAQ